MKKIFKSYQTPSSDEFTEIWNNCLFVVDTNVLLSLYRYSESTRDELLGILDNYKDRLWLPYQVGLEFFRNRVKVILDQKLTYDQLSNELEKITLDFSKALDAKCSRHPFIDAKAFKDKFIESMDGIKEEISKKKNNHPDLMGDDKTLESINNLYEDKVGAPFDENELKKYHKEAEDRYKEKIPPGYEDLKKEGDRQFGDYIVWKQILNKAGEVKKPIILITDDRKEDWWLNVNGMTISPRPELIEEMKKCAGVDFYMYQSDMFVKRAAKLLKEPITEQRVDKAVREIQELRIDEESKELEKDDLADMVLRNYLSDENQQSYYDWFNIKDISKKEGLLAWQGRTKDELENSIFTLEKLNRIEQNKYLYNILKRHKKIKTLLVSEEYEDNNKKQEPDENK